MNRDERGQIEGVLNGESPGCTICATCETVCGAMPEACIDAIVTDPPYGLTFMGKAWDHGVPGIEFWQEFLRVARPGCHLLAFGGTRTYHRLACAIEDAGWEIRDCLMWLYGTGFPKSLDVGKAIDKAKGMKRGPAELQDYVGRENWKSVHGRKRQRGEYVAGTPPQQQLKRHVTAPATHEAAQWDGWGTALKPGWEPILLARKPLDGTVAANVLEHGTGAMNIDGCRIGVGGYDAPGDRGQTERTRRADFHMAPGKSCQKGRWPANVCLSHHPECIPVPSPCRPPRPPRPRSLPSGTMDDVDGVDGVPRSAPVESWQCHPDCPLRLLDEQSGELTSGGCPVTRPPHRNVVYGTGFVGQNQTKPGVPRNSGGASRFFYCAKASRAERTANASVDNKHPTVKPLALMQWLCRLICPPGGIILDPFCGSGSTLIAAAREGLRYVGIDSDAASVKTSRQRLAAEMTLFSEAASTGRTEEE